MKKIALMLMSLLLICALGFMFGCGSSDEPPEEPPTSNAEVAFKLQSLDLYLGDETVLEYSCSGLDVDPTFSSSAPTIVSVNEYAQVVALDIGSATITATYGDKTATITINVGFGELVPEIRFADKVLDEELLNEKEVLNLSAYVAFNNKQYMDGKVKYTVDRTTGKVENGVFSATEIGIYNVTVNIEWKGQTLTKVVKITTKSAIELYVNDNTTTKFEVYTLSQFDGKSWANEIPFEICAKENGEDVVPTVEFVSGADCIDYDETEKTITGVKAGETKIKISYKTSEYLVTVKTNTVFAEHPEVVEFSALEGTLPIEEIFGENVALSKVVDKDGNEYSVENNVISGVTVTKEKPLETTLTIATDVISYKVDIKAYTRIINSQSELQETFALSREEGSNTDHLKANAKDGYYVLGNDIEPEYKGTNKVLYNVGTVSGLPYPGWYYSYQTGGLTGTFDGRGYTIKDLAIYQWGLFGITTGVGQEEQAVIKNVSIENCELIGAWNASMATVAHSMKHTRMENVNVSAEKIKVQYIESLNSYPTVSHPFDGQMVTNRALVACFVSGWMNFENCIFTVPEIEGTEEKHGTYDITQRKSYGSIFCRDHWSTTYEQNEYHNKTVFTDCYVISPHYAGFYVGSDGNNNLVSGIGKDAAVIFDAVNRVDELNTAIAGNSFPTGVNATTKVYSFDGLYRYDSLDDMKSATGNDYTSFKGCWKIEGGIPVWNKNN